MSEEPKLPKKHGMKGREFHIEDAYHIFDFFIMHFWWDFLKGVMIEKGIIIDGLTPEEHESASPNDQVKSKLYHAYYSVFIVAPGDPAGCGDDLERILEKNYQIKSARKLKNLVVREGTLFQLVIDFCNHFNDQFEGPPHDYPKDAARFGIDWLKDMRKHPEKHQTEWKMWNHWIDKVLYKGAKAYGSFSGEEW